MNIFHLPTPQKRKRDRDDINDENDEHHVKRKAIGSLAIRPSPLRVRPLAPAFTSFNPPAPLTPDDTSGDESLPGEDERLAQANIARNSSDLSNGSTDSAPSLTVHVSPERYDENDMMMISPTRPRFGRARSNDLISPPRLATTSSVLTPPYQANPMNDRVPTPINSTFDNRLSHLPAAPRQQFPPLRKFLSPMMEQEAFAGPPTPVEDTMQMAQDSDVMMGYEQTSNSLSGLKVTTDEDDAMDQDTTPASLNESVTPNWGLDGSASQDQSRAPGRIAKLHMGFMAGCSRCAQKVPGHYSHIIWEASDGSRVVRNDD